MIKVLNLVLTPVQRMTSSVFILRAPIRILRASTIILLLYSIACVTASAQSNPPASRPPNQPQLQLHPRYTLTPGDVLDVNYRYSPDFNQTATIQPDGFVALKVVGSVRVGGLTLDEAHDLIVKEAAERLNNPEVNLTLKDFQAPSITVAGEVLKPGKIPFRQGTTALQAILISGGFGENARAGQVILFRRIDGENAEVKILKLDNIKKRAALEHDLPLVPGDMILVPRDRIAIISRYIKLANVGFYFNPLQNIP
jgi:polysaccharide export outer membrane protein